MMPCSLPYTIKQPCSLGPTPKILNLRALNSLACRESDSEVWLLGRHWPEVRESGELGLSMTECYLFAAALRQQDA